MDKLLKFYVKVFYVIGKVLSDELSCSRTHLVYVLHLQRLCGVMFS